MQGRGGPGKLEGMNVGAASSGCTKRNARTSCSGFSQKNSKLEGRRPGCYGLSVCVPLKFMLKS